MGVLIWRSLVTPEIFSAPSGETMRQTSKRFRGSRTCSRSSITIPSLVWLGFHPPPGWRKNVEFFVCPSLLWTSEFIRPISPWRRWRTEMILMLLDRGRFVVVHPCSTFSDCRQLSTSLNAEVQKMAKIVFFSPPEGDRMNRPRRPQKSKLAKNCGFLATGSW